ncbi:MAG: LpqB family beta-propeller domain-containing protein [Acidobacteria bacterium]|nr:LpqB family beta-propeller domain-containing protein [Acidobacteriota bacterium]
MSKPDRQVYEFGAFRVDPLKRLLLRDGAVVSLTPKAFDILLVLIRNSGEVQEKEELMRAVWHDTVVEENNLTRNISSLRKALGEQPDKHQYVVTIPGRGYCFVAHVIELQGDGVELTMERDGAAPINAREKTDGSLANDGWAATSSGESNSARHFTFFHRRTAWVVVAAALILIFAGAAIGVRHWVSQRQSLARRPEPFQKIRLTKLTNTGDASAAAISPDGKYVAFVRTEGSRQSLWVRHTATASNVRLIAPAVIDYWGLTFTRDGNYIYYVGHEYDQANSALFRVPVLGGLAPQKILDNPDNAVAFSPDGRRLAYISHSSYTAESVLLTAGLDGDGQQKLAVRKAPDFFSPWSAAGLAWSPDGQVIVSAAGALNQHARYLVEVRVAGGEQKALGGRSWADLKRVAWLSDGSGLVMVAKDEPAAPYQLWRFTYSTGEASRITNDLLEYRGVSLTADDHLLVTTQREAMSSIRVSPDANAGQFKQLDPGAGKLSGDDGLAWTPDHRLVYRSDASGQSEVWIAEAGGGVVKQLTLNAKVKGPLSVSPDGHSIIFSSNRTGIEHIWRTGIDGGAPQQLTRGSGEIYSSLSPDGRWLIYQQQDSQSLGQRLWKMPLQGGEARLLTSEPSYRPAVSPDSRWVAYFYMDQSHWGIAITPLTGGAPVKRFRIPSSVVERVVRWTTDGKALAYIDDRDGASNIWLQPIDGGAPRQLTDFKAGRILYFDWSRDGQRLAISRGAVTSDIVMIDNLK